MERSGRKIFLVYMGRKRDKFRGGCCECVYVCVCVWVRERETVRVSESLGGREWRGKREEGWEMVR